VKSAAVYTGARALVFLVFLGLGLLVGLRGFLLIVVALVLSIPVSYFFLARLRESFAADVERKIDGRRGRRSDLRSQLRGDDETAA
jgi:Protein of unknown function (DUF4229)